MSAPLPIDITPTDEQHQALKGLAALVEDGPNTLVMAGLAGTGKTTLMRLLAFMLRASGWEVLWCAPTGKAAARLRDKVGEEVRTIHSLIYRSVRADEVGTLHFGDLRPICGPRTVVIADEASMIGFSLGRDLRACIPKDSKLVLVGDDGQLEPIDEAWYADFSQAHVRLVEVHRQALESALLRKALDIRLGRVSRFPRESEGNYTWMRGTHRDAAQWLAEREREQADATLLAWTNLDRARLNRLVRQDLGRDGALLRRGEPVLVLSNSKVHKIMNGEVVRATGLRASDHHREGDYAERVFELAWEGKQTGHPALVHKDTFGADRAEFTALLGRQALRGSWLHVDHGYTLTGHKAQGSEWPSAGIVLTDGAAFALSKSPPAKRGPRLRRWAYTVLTRASGEALVVDTMRGG